MEKGEDPMTDHNSCNRHEHRWVLVVLLLMSGGPAMGGPGLMRPPGLMDEVDQIVENAENMGVETPAPGFRVPDMYGDSVALEDYRGRILVMAFLTPSAQGEAQEWLRSSQVDYLGDPNIAFVNVLYPGPTSILTGKRSRLVKVRDQIEDAYRNFYDQLHDGDRARLKNTEIRWILDWRRDLIRRYDVRGDRVHIVIVDPMGSVREVIRRRTPETASVLPRVIEALRAEMAQSVPNPQDRSAGW